MDMFNFLKKRKVDYDVSSDSNKNNSIKNNVKSDSVEAKIDDVINKIAELQKKCKYDDAMAMTQELIKMANGLSEDEKTEVLAKFRKAMDEIDENDDNSNKSEIEKVNEKNESAAELDKDESKTETKVDGSETARQNKIKETLIDPNPLYTKWYNYFWKNKLHEDAQAKKFCPIWYDTMYNQEHRIWNGIDLTENAWNMAAGCIYGDIAPVLNFEVVCTVGIRDEFSTAYGLLANNIDEKKMIGLDCYINKEKELIENLKKMTENQIEANDIRFGKCLVSLNSDKINSLSICERFILRKWEEFCPSSIYDINPETDTEERYWERRNALSKVYEIFSKYTYYSKNLSNAFAIATEYFEFVEQNNK
jgi:hypothetical protein